jgi:hypothetical protein
MRKNSPADRMKDSWHCLAAEMNEAFPQKREGFV